MVIFKQREWGKQRKKEKDMLVFSETNKAPPESESIRSE